MAVKNVHGQRAGSVLWRAIWRARWVVLVAALVAGVGGYLVSSQQSSEYTSSSSLVLGQTKPFSPLGDQSFSETSRYVLNQASTITSQDVVEAAVVALGDGTTFTDLYDSLDVSASANSDVINVEATAPTAQAAAERVRATVDAYRAYVAASIAEEAVAAERATTDPQVIDEIRTRAAAFGDGVYVAEEAPVPGDPTGPHPVRDGLILALVAALVAVTVALWRRSSAPDESLLSDAPVRVLGTVDLRSSDRAGRTAPLAEDCAITAVALGYAVASTPGPVLVSGLSPDSPVGPVVDGLAAVEAARGKRVLVVDADSRGKALVAATRTRPPLPSLTALVSQFGTDGAPTEDPGAGSVRVARVEGLDADSVQGALTSLAGRFDAVILRVGPVASDARAFELLAVGSAVVAVVDAKDRSADLAVLMERLDVAGRPLVGLVATRSVRGIRRPGSEPSAPVTAEESVPLADSEAVPSGR